MCDTILILKILKAINNGDNTEKISKQKDTTLNK